METVGQVCGLNLTKSEVGGDSQVCSLNLTSSEVGGDSRFLLCADSALPDCLERAGPMLADKHGLIYNFKDGGDHGLLRSEALAVVSQYLVT